ncbi:hypothetical protein P4606_05005 [Priestia aryabhattai]|uniref:hypothetical protein n=1 Tax=Priestia aryabhattai TaxID=412384 RepID=UPI002E1D807E|nr:hypothetical protein [Priestia aryabhattai]
MEIICELDKGELVLTKDKSNFENIIQSLKSSKKILVSTYSIDFKLFNNIDSNTSLEVIVNIPSLKKMWYIDELKRLHKKFTNVSTYISLDNHSKIIISDTGAYIGSANFSESSYDNFECGIRVGVENLPQIYEMFKALKKDAILYDGTNYKVTRISIIIQQINEIKVGIENFVDDLKCVKEMIETHYKNCQHYMDLKDFESENFEYILTPKLKELVNKSREVLYAIEDNEDEFLDDLDEATVENANSFMNEFTQDFDKLIEYDMEKYRDKRYMQEAHWTTDESELLTKLEEEAIEELVSISNNCLQKLTKLTNHLENNFIPSLKSLISSLESLEQNAEESYKPTSSSSNYEGKKNKVIEELEK